MSLRVVPNAPRVVGIDLGTTNSLVAVLEGGVPRILPNAVGDLLTPSAVSIGDEGTVLVGAAAKARAVTHPERTAVSFKRDMGTPRVHMLAAQGFGAVELSALVLSSLKRDAEAHLGGSITDAVISVPAYFGELQRQATRDAATIAGLRAVRIVNEPTAAALAFGLGARDRELRAAVLDLGGGTFDVTILQITEGVIEVLSTAGDARLGGDDFTDVVAELLRQDVISARRGDLFADRAAAARVLAAAEQAKRALAERDAVEVSLVSVPTRSGIVHYDGRLERRRVEQAFAGLLARMRAPVGRALADAALDVSAIDEVLLVGGATRLPCVRALAAETFGREPRTSLPPDEAIALGAAAFAGLHARDEAVSDLVVTDVAPFSLGVAVAEHYERHVVTGVFSPILERGTVIPASRSRTFHTGHELQKEIRIEVFQGEHSMCADNQRLGELRVLGLAPKPPGEREQVDVRFSFDLSGLLEVEVTISSSGWREVLLLEQSPGKLSPAQIAESRERFQRLRIHPRELLPNATALARGDALYVELVGQAREELGAVLAAFRAALEGGEPTAVERVRAVLVEVTRRHAR